MNVTDKTVLPVGVGIDLVLVSGLRNLVERVGDSFIEHTFTERERKEAEKASDKFTYLAGRFAVKEAVFKAVAHLTEEKSFDFRIVETVKRSDGSPEIYMNSQIHTIFKEANVQNVLVSISNEGDYVIAIAQAVRK